MQEQKQIVEILWTGGFDSTFRVTQLSRKQIVVQPYYLSDNRQSEKYELNAISEITKLLSSHPSTQCEFKPLVVIGKNERTHNQEISNAYHRVLLNDFIGSQYEWLGCFAEKHVGVEMSIHKDDKAIGVIQKYGKLQKANNNAEGDYYVVDKGNSSADVITLWGNIHLPLADITKLQMKDWYLSNGYSDVMNKTWFCFTPINGKPCGKCNPCKYTIEEGMKERFTKPALLRYYLYKTLDLFQVRKIVSRLRKRAIGFVKS